MRDGVVDEIYYRLAQAYGVTDYDDVLLLQLEHYIKIRLFRSDGNSVSQSMSRELREINRSTRDRFGSVVRTEN